MGKSLLCTLCENPVLEEKIRISHDFDSVQIVQK